jgi:hypothetical protein
MASDPFSGLKFVIRFSFLAAKIAIACVLAACSTSPVGKSTIIGHWVATPQNHLIIKEPAVAGCEFIFKADGSFTSSKFLDYLINTPDNASGKIHAGSGKWSIMQKNGSNIVDLIFTDIDNCSANTETTSLIISDWGGHPLFFWLGEEGGDRFEFERK